MIDKALLSLCPGAHWTLDGDEYSGITWHDTTIVKPTKQQVEQEVERLKLAHQRLEYQRQRAKEYPPITDYLDGLVKGDQEQIQAYIDACLAVKTKFPKPE